MDNEARTQCGQRLEFDGVPNQASSGPPWAAWPRRIAHLDVSQYGRVALILMLLVNSGCRTEGVSGSGQRIWIPCNRITEDELKARGLRYEKYQLTKERLKRAGIECPDKTMEWYVVEKSDLEKLGDTVLCIALAPVLIPVYCVVMGGALVLAAQAP